MSYVLELSPLLAPLAGDATVMEAMSSDADVSAILLFEMELAKAQEEHGRIPKGSAARIEKTIEAFELDLETLMDGMARDGVVVPVLIAELRAKLGKDLEQHLHKDATSQDAVDTSFMIRAAAALSSIEERLGEIDQGLHSLMQKFGAKSMMGRTRMQVALPISVKDRLKSWSVNVDGATHNIEILEFPLQLSGPVGTQADENVMASLAQALGLIVHQNSWQNERSPVLAIGNACAGVTGALGKIGADISLMAQNELAEIKLSGSGGSSAMPHKQNPVKAEVLVSLARYNASLLSALHNAAVHEQERSGAAWTLEWLVMPQMICNAGGAARLCKELLDSIESIGA